MTSAERFEDLDVWKRSRELANFIYDVSETGAFSKDYGLRDQMRRAAVSIMSNIGEGFESHTQALFVQLLARAKGSAGELRAQLYLAHDRNYLVKDDFDKALEQTEICSKQLTRFIQYLESKPNARRIREDGEAYDVETTL